MSRNWREVPAGVINGAQQRFWHELGVHAGVIAARINIDPAYLNDLVAYAVRRMHERGEDNDLLELVETVSVPSYDQFVSEEKFREGQTIDDVSIAWLGDNFKRYVLGKIETNVPAAELKVSKLLKAARDLPKDNEPGIIPALNGKHETALAHFHSLLKYKQQKKDYSWIIAYIIGNNGVTLWAVDAIWDSGYRGWYVWADSVEHPFRWVAGYQVASC